MNAGERIRKTNPKVTKKWCIVPLVMVAVLASFLFLAGMSVILAWTDPPDHVSSSLEYDQYDPQMAVDADGFTHVVWYGYDQDYDEYFIYYATNAGGTWSAPTLISTQSDYDQYDPQIALDSGGNAHVVWYGYDPSDSYEQIYYSTNTGGTWSDPELLSTQSDYDQYYCQIALDSNDIAHVVWEGYDRGENYYHIYYVTNAGGTWSDPELLSTQSDYSQYEPQIAVDSSDNINVAWYGYDPSYDYEQIYFAAKSGGAWSSPERVSTNSGYGQDNVRMALGPDGSAHLVWEGYDSGEVDELIWYATNLGGVWSEPQDISPDDSSPYYPSVAVDSQNNAYAVFHSHSGSGCDIGYTTNASGSWIHTQIISGDHEHSGSNWPKIVVDSIDNLRVVWEGYGPPDENYKIFYTVGTGSGWSTPMDLSTQSDYYQYAPVITLDIDDNPHVAWYGYDSGENYYAIWYAEDITQRVVTARVEGTGGTVDPASQAVPIGGTATITMTPDEGYSVESVTDNGVLVTPTPEDSYSITNVTEHHDVVVTFAKGSGWFLAEGCTGEGFETWILVENPGDEPATVNMLFDTDKGGVVFTELQGLIVPAHSRASYNLGSYIQTYDVATEVTADANVVCERAVYGPDRAWATCSVGTTMPSYSWYLPEGCTGEGFESWILVQNPNDYDVSVNLALNTDMGRIATSTAQGLIVPSHSRASYNLADYYTSFDVATEVTSEGGSVVVERSMYAADRAWAHNSIGSPATASTWYLAEGCTVDMDTWVLVQNPNNIPVEVDLKHLTENGEVQGPSGVIPPFTRVSYNVADTVQSYNVSTKVTSKYGGVVAERSMYAPDRSWGTCSIGTTTPATTWFLAEGCTVDMDTWILVANPGTETATVSLLLNTGEGQQAPAGLQNLIIPAGSRASFHLNDFVTTYEVSTMVTSDLPVVCERAMYGPDKAWADASIGYAP